MTANSPKPQWRRMATLAFLTLLVSPLNLQAHAEAPLLPAMAASDRQTRLGKLATAIDAEREALHIPGVALVVVQGDEVLLAKGFGKRDLARSLPVTDHTLFAIGSTTKAMTAMAALMAQEAGKLSLDDHPRRFLPYFKLRDPDADRRVTLRDLLSHQTGVNRADLPMITGALSAEELIRLMAQIKPTAKLRERFLYQNTMYAAAGFSVGKAFGQSWDQVVSDRIFKPLGMSQATTTLEGMLVNADHALGYDYDKAKQRFRRLPFRPITHTAPAGSVNANVTDLAKWLRFLVNGGQFEGRRLVSAESFAAFTRPMIPMGGKMSYALGWMVDEWQGQPYVWHNGSIDGFNTAIGFLPEQKLGFALLTNVSDTPLTNTAANLIWSHLIDSETPVTAAKAPAARPLKVTDPLGKALLGTYKDEARGFELTLGEKDFRVALVVPGQRPYPLIPLGDHRYSLEGLPESFRLEVSRDSAGVVTGLLLMQPQGNLSMKPLPPYQSPLTVEALMTKVVAAAGGEANIRKHRTMLRQDELKLEHQGLTGEAISRMQAPNLSATESTFKAFNRPIATVFEYFDGKQGGETTSFSEPDIKSGAALADMALASDFYGDLNWRRYKDVRITGKETIGGEECYVVALTPETGNAVTNVYSAKTFLPIQQRGIKLAGGEVPMPYTTTFSDFRTVDGVVMPFRAVVYGPAIGEIITQTVSVVFDAAIPAAAFTPGGMPAGR